MNSELCRLSDIFAPTWDIDIEGVVYNMKPLSIATFSELEARGWTMAALTKGNYVMWVEVFIYLADMDKNLIEHMSAMFMSNPSEFKLFQHAIAESFVDDVNKLSNNANLKQNKRKVVNPNDEQESSEDEIETQYTDMGFIVTVSRLSGISLADISRMSFRGLRSINKSLEELPPTPPMM